MQASACSLNFALLPKRDLWGRKRPVDFVFLTSSKVMEVYSTFKVSFFSQN